MTLSVSSTSGQTVGRVGLTSGHLSVGRIGLYLFLLSAFLFFATPLYVIVTTSLKTMEEVRAGTIFSLPLSPTFEAWAKAWSGACTGLTCNGISVGFWNSIQIVVPSIAFSILLGALNGYALAHWKLKRAGSIMLFLMLCTFIPYQTLLYPMVKMYSSVGLYSTLPGIILVHVTFGVPVATLIFRNFYTGIPEDLVKAARMDGAGFFRSLFSIMLPMSKSIIVVALILKFTAIWNDFLLGLIFAGRENLPMTVQLNNIVNTQMGEKEYNVDMAATLLTAIPPLLVYLISGRYFVRGIAAGAVKG